MSPKNVAQAEREAVPPPLPEADVPAEYRRGTRPVRYRNSDCYEHAARYVLGHDLPGVTLVHGVYGPYGRGHAWVELALDDGRWCVAYDPNWHRFYPLFVYVDAAKAREEVRYSRVEAAQRMSATRHSGPWHDPAPGEGKSTRRLRP